MPLNQRPFLRATLRPLAATLAACALLSACGGDDGDAGQGAAE